VIQIERYTYRVIQIQSDIDKGDTDTGRYRYRVIQIQRDADKGDTDTGRYRYRVIQTLNVVLNVLLLPGNSL